jgi:hypothetical protein
MAYFEARSPLADAEGDSIRIAGAPEVRAERVRMAPDFVRTAVGGGGENAPVDGWSRRSFQLGLTAE